MSVGIKRLVVLRCRRAAASTSSFQSSGCRRCGICGTLVRGGSYCSPCALDRGFERGFATLNKPNNLLRVPSGSFQRRGLGWVAAAARSLLKLRYLVLGGAIGGGASLARQYEEWKKNLPDASWIKELMPEIELDKFRSSLIKARESIKGKAKDIDMDPALRATMGKFSSYRQWFEKRLDAAIQEADKRRLEEQDESAEEGDAKAAAKLPSFSSLRSKLADLSQTKVPLSSGLSLTSIGGSGGNDQVQRKLDDERQKNESLQRKLESTQEELMRTQIRYQKELESLEKQNRELRKQLLLRSNSSASSRKQIKKSLIDMYSEVLDELSGYDSSYNTADHLPRVVVIGDQSSGKTSVLEMVAQARLFPRGGGEMMTRAPVKVTLSEGPYHVAQFKDSQREFDLSKESDLADLRREVEVRMKKSVRAGKTISNEVISMTVKGPGLQRMVLVDLPGVISTVTTEMDPTTGTSIKKLAQQYMSNPNSIILCIQDGSVDAERSNVTDLVSSMDPSGKRTIFVLTKVDLAEQNLADPSRIQKILAGKLFPMKALGYFAVVTGKDGKSDTIQSIKEHEEQFFARSKIFKGGMVNSSQITTRNLSFAVSECFWKMVRDTVEQQADAFKATRFNLETEWKNNFPRIRELDRDELFEKARGEILDEVVNLSLVSPQTWEEAIGRKLWEKVAPYVFEGVYLPAAQGRSNGGTGCDRPISSRNRTGTFNTTVDIKLKHWAENQLGLKCVEVGWETLEEEFRKLMQRSKKAKDHDDIFDRLKAAVVDDAMRRHAWEDKAAEMLRVIQLNTLEDRSVHDKDQWCTASQFLERSVNEKLAQSEANIREQVGPGFYERWVHFMGSSKDQDVRMAVKAELERILASEAEHKSQLAIEELTTVKRNLQTSGADVDNETIREVWHPVYRRNFLQKALSRCHECRKGFYLYNQGLENDLDCNDIVLFWRIQQMLKVTANALRQQVMNREARRLEKEIKDVLEEYSQDPEKKEKLLTGRRVQIAEELKRVRQIQERLEEFIKALNTGRD